MTPTRIAVAFLLAWMSLALAARDTSAGDGDDEFVSSSLRAGRSAFQFEVGGGFDIGGFDDATVSYKRQTSERGAWRYGLTFNGGIQDSDGIREEWVDTTIAPVGLTSEHDRSLSIGASVTRVQYAGGSGRVRPFVGFGPFVSYGHSKSTEDDSFVYPYEELRYFERSSSTWHFGARALLGAEVFVARQISILGQYATSLSYARGEETFISVRTGELLPTVDARRDTRSSHLWSLGRNTVSLGLSAYF